jgi:hypothetical protein
MAWDYMTGALIWSRDIISVGPLGLFGQTRWGRFTVLTIAGTDVVYWGTDDGKVVAADALTGVLYGGWGTNPVDLSLSTFVSGATDGENLYYCTFGAGVEGDVYSIDAATGVINWALSSADPNGLYGDDVWTHDDGYFGDEGFTAGVMYDNGVVYANSRAQADHPTDGLFYRINAGTGAVLSATLANRGFYQTPINDVNHVYMPTLTRWVGAPAGGNLYKVNKLTGNLDLVYTDVSEGRYYVDGVATCEPEPEPDLLYLFNENGFLECLNTIDFDQIYRRRIFNISGYAPNIGMAGALAHDPLGESHLLFATFWGNLIDMTKQDDRPRLEIQSYNLTLPVEFGPAASIIDTIPDVFTNTGCWDLNITGVAADENPFVPDIPDFASAKSVDVNFMNRASSIADELTYGQLKMMAQIHGNEMVDDGITSVRDEALSRERINRAAAGFPPYLNSVLEPYVGQVISPGDTTDVVLDIIQAGFTRGPHNFYLQVDTDDPDFFLNHTAPKQTLPPALLISLVGGCLIDTTTLHFGVGAANTRLVTNTGRVGTGDWTPHAYEIDGENDDYYQGAYVYAVSKHRIAVHTQDWISGGGEANAFVSMQPDPNWCDNDCHPFLETSPDLGEITNDGGVTYVAIDGDLICKSFVDSVQNFDVGFGWTWGASNGVANSPWFFDNDSTMGLYGNGRVAGAVDVPELANVTVEILEIYERNGDSLTDWYIGEMLDQDVLTGGGSHDTAIVARSISTAICYAIGNATDAIGQIKLPFGCGHDPLINAWGTYGASGAHGFWGWNQFWDTLYNGYMVSGPGNFADGGDMTLGDGEAYFNYAQNDFGPNDTFDIGIAHFARYDMTDASDTLEYAALAHLVNKWTGGGRGDMNNDNVLNLVDIVLLAGHLNGGPGPVPFKHLRDVNADGSFDMADLDYLIDFYFRCGDCPVAAWTF